MLKKFLPIGILIALIALTPASAFAVGSGGFENAVFSAKQLGTGGTGTATPDEPAAISYNPAGIVDLPGIQIQGDANFESMFTWKDSKSTGSTRSSGTLALVPTAYMTINPGKIFCDRVAFGIGTDSPFGLMNKYDSTDPIVKYTGWKNWLKMYTIKPTIAFKITDKISIGGGPMWYRVYDFGMIQAYPNVLTGGAGDGQLRMNTSGNHWGWQMGALAKINEKNRLGFYFRSPVVVKVSGLGKVENSTSGNFETGVHSKLPLPLNMTFSYAFQPTKKTFYEASFGYTHWSINQRLRINADPLNPANPVQDNALRLLGTDAGTDKDYTNGYSYHLGASHKLTKKLTLRGGTYFFMTPVPKAHFNPAVPDANRLTLSLGLGYDINKYLTADLAYYDMFFFRRRIGNDIGNGLGTSVDGTYTSLLQGFTISLTAHWDDIFPRAFGNKGNEVDPPSIEMPTAK